MALTASTHKVAQSVSGTTFKVLTDGTDAVQQVAPVTASWENSATVAGSATALNGGSPGILLRVIIGTPSSSGTLELVDNSASLAIIETDVARTIEFGCWFTSLTYEQKTDAADITFVYA